MGVRRARLYVLSALVAALTCLALGAPALLAAESDLRARAIDAPPPPAAADAVEGLVGALADEAAAIERRALADEASPPEKRAPALTEDEARTIAEDDGDLRGWVGGREITRTTAELDDDGVWEVSFVGPDGDDERIEALVRVSDERGEIVEVRTGPQVGWMMARGYDGAFGRAVNRPAIWIPLMIAFLVPLLDLRRLVSFRTLDLLVLLSFGMSLIWFNRGEIFTSVPLVYPPLVYLGLRLGWIAYARSDLARSRAAPTLGPSVPASSRPRLTAWPPTWVMTSLLAVVLALRYGLNAFDANVIDVGYAGVIGADRIASGITPYGTFPEDCARCDTYGPLNYVAYVPFELAHPWHGSWDALPAAHGAASTFDALCVVGMLALGWGLGGARLGMALALAWAAFPFTAYALETNANDSLVATCLIWGLVLARRPAGRGALLGLAMAAKLGPAVLLPLWSRHPFPRARAPGALWRFAAGLGLAAVATGWVLLLDGLEGVRAFGSRTIGYQLGRDSPFSIWGQHPELRPLQVALTIALGLGALALLRWPRRLDLLQMIALSGVLVIGLELTLTHWFYLYIPWSLPFALVAMVPEWPAPSRRPAPPPEGRWRVRRRRPEPEPVSAPA